VIIKFTSEDRLRQQVEIKKLNQIVHNQRGCEQFGTLRSSASWRLTLSCLDAPKGRMEAYGAVQNELMASSS